MKTTVNIYEKGSMKTTADIRDHLCFASRTCFA